MLSYIPTVTYNDFPIWADYDWNLFFKVKLVLQILFFTHWTRNTYVMLFVKRPHVSQIMHMNYNGERGELGEIIEIKTHGSMNQSNWYWLLQR